MRSGEPGWTVLAACALVLGLSAASAEKTPGAGAKPPESKAQESWARRHHVLGRLELSDEQARTIDELFAKMNRDLAAAAAPLLETRLTPGERAARQRAVGARRREIREDSWKRILAQLSAEQKKKHDLAWSLIAAFDRKRREMLEDMRKRSVGAGIVKKRNIRKEVGVRLKKLQAEHAGELDRKVGELPGKPKPQPEKKPGPETEPKSEPKPAPPERRVQGSKPALERGARSRWARRRNTRRAAGVSPIGPDAV
jgi:hypothetical protein